MTAFISTFKQMLILFILIFIGFLLVKLKILDKGSAGVLAKLENNVFIPALVLFTFLESFTFASLNSSWKLFLGGFGLFAVIVPISVLGARFCGKDKYTRNINTYGLVFSNFAFMGNAVVGALFPDTFSDYLIFTLPFWIMIYLWGVPKLLMGGEGEKKTLPQKLKVFLNPMLVAMIIGIILGLAEFPVPSWLMTTISYAANCMSPVAMLLTGITVACIPLGNVLKKGSIYLFSVLRLFVFPLLFLVIFIFTPLSDSIIICAVCTLSMPLGLNAIVVPSALGKDTTTAAGLAVVSHLLSCISIPVVFMLLQLTL